MKVLLVSEGKHEQAGALRELIKRLAPQIDETEEDRVANNSIHAHHGKGQGYFKRAVRWMLEAQKRGVFDAVVLLIDEDRRPDRVQEIEKAQSDTTARIRRALGVAIPTFDAWMLADEERLCAVLGQTIRRQPDPESTHDAKSICAQLLAESQLDLRQADMYAAIVREVNLEKLEARCSQGFAPFARRVRSL